MPNRKRKKLRAAFMYLQLILLVLLLLVPVTINGDSTVQNSDGTAVNPQLNDVNYWPPVIARLEAEYAKKPNDPQVINSLASAYNNYGVLLANNGQWSQAESYLQQAIELSPNPDAMRKNLSNVYYEQGAELYKNHTSAYTTYRSSDAAQLAEKAIAADPQNVNAYLLLGDIKYMDQDMRAAQKYWQQAAALVPNDQAVQQRLAQIERETSTEADMNTVFNPYFNIKVDPSVSSNPNFDINKILNYAHDNVAPDFNFIQNFVVPVVVYNQGEYHQTMVDAPGWAEAVYDGKIRFAITDSQTDFKQINSDVAHEYTHVIVGSQTNNNCPRWFNEGLAKFEEYRHGIPPRIYLLALAYNTNEIIAWDKIDQAIVSPDVQEALLAYQQVFSFVYYLVNRYGMQKINQTLQLLGTKADFATAIQQAYGVSIDTLQKNWRLWLTDFITNWADQPGSMGVGYAMADRPCKCSLLVRE